jgi:hypothetical protein
MESARASSESMTTDPISALFLFDNELTVSAGAGEHLDQSGTVAVTTPRRHR